MADMQNIREATIERFECWINKEAKILSFHFEEGFAEKIFLNEAVFKQFVYDLAGSYKVQ